MINTTAPITRTSAAPTPNSPSSTLETFANPLVHRLQMYVFSQDLATRGAKKLEKKNVVLTKDGMKVHVKEVGAEEYVDRTQGAFVKAWSYTSTPGYQSKLWSGKPQEGNNGGKNK